MTICHGRAAQEKWPRAVFVYIFLKPRSNTFYVSLNGIPSKTSVNRYVAFILETG